MSKQSTSSNKVSLGIGYALIAALLYSVMSALVKQATETIPFAEVIFFRGLIGMLMIAPYMWWNKISLVGHRWDLLVLRTLFGVIAIFTYFYGLSVIPLTTAVTFNFIAPIWVAVFSGFFLHERSTRRFWILLFTAALGSYFILNPSLELSSLPYYITFSSGLFAALSLICVRKSQFSENTWIIVFYFLFGTTVCALVWNHGQINLDLTTSEWSAVFGIAIISTLAQLFATASYRYGPAPLMSAFNFLTPLISCLWGIMFWGEIPTGMMVLGIGLILFSGLIITIYHNRLIDTAGKMD